MPKLDLTTIAQRTGSGYPAPFDRPTAGRIRQALGDAAGLSQFGVNLLQLPPGGWSSQRHWHTAEEEFVFVVSGELTLVTNAGETVLRAGDCAGFPAGRPDGHHLVNKSSAPAVCLEVGSRIPGDSAHYPDIDLFFDGVADQYTRRDGTPLPRRQP
jgi:uncharacterized cupin superfamily protein